MGTVFKLKAGPFGARTGLLTYSQAALMLRMSEDTLRRIPTAELPRYKPGKTVLFDIDDVKQYLRTYKKISHIGAEKVSLEQRKLIEFCADSTRSRSLERRTK
ncbi:MAG: helix-turn-helix domain-containing protein [Alphaproteobacteria bacterium]|nr:helix-turn-helix domain-containing protein [Alphaproteobacteria bacterium]